MKRTLNILGFVVLGFICIIYLCFLFLLPNTINLNNYKEFVQNIAKEQANIEIDFDNAKIITTPLLGAGAKVDNVSIKLPDGSVLFSADSIKTRIALPSLLLLTVKISCFDIENPFVNLEIDQDNVDYKVVKLVENILNTQKESTLGIEEKKEITGFQFDPAWIRIKVPCVKLNNYKVLITDLKSGHYLDIHGDELKAGYFNGKVAKLKTYAELFSDENRNITANISINTFIPQSEPLDNEDDPANRIDIPFTNPVDLYRTYDLKANIDTKLKVREHNGDITSFGHINIDDVTLKVSQLQLPISYAHIKAFRHTLNLDTNIYPIENQNIQLLGKLNYSNRPKLDMNIKIGSIQFNDMIILGKAFLDSLSIPNELGQFKAEGSIIADCYIKTNFKKLKSNGFIKIQNGGLSVRNLGQVISNANINALFDNNVLNLENSSLFVNQSKITIDGKIDEKSVADIKVQTEELPLPALFNAFAPKELRNAYNFRSGDVTLNATVSGKLKQAIASANFDLDNFNLADKDNNFNIKDTKLTGEFKCETKRNALTGSIQNTGFSLILPKTESSVIVPNLQIEIADKNVSIPLNKILFNDNSEIKFSGEIINYEKLKDIKFNLNGDVNTDDLVKVIGKEYKPYIHSAGVIPVKLELYGNKKKQTIVTQALADKDNFITPVDLTELREKETSLQSVIDLKPGRIKIKKTGMYIRTISVDEEGNEIVNLDDIIDIDGTIEGDRINLIKINIPKILNGKIHIFPNSSLILDKAHILVYGESYNPLIKGEINVREVNIPELLTSVADTKFDFKGHILGFNINDILLNNSDITVSGNIDLNPSSVVNVTNLDVTSKNLNVDKLLKVTELAMAYMPDAPAGNLSQTDSDIPVTVHNGSINMKRIITGNIEVLNTTSRMILRRNILALREMRTNIFKGRVNGDIFVDLITMLVDVDLSGENIDVEKAMLDAAGMKDMLSGTAKFNAKLSIDGAAQTIEEQMKGISGDVDFTVLDGQYGPFGKIENLIIAENIRESQIFQTALGGIINSLTTIDTTHFSKLDGHLNFEEGICNIDPITSVGNVLTLHIFGDFDLIRNYADMKVRAKMSSIISKLLGPLNAINPVNIMNSAASMNIVTAKAFSLFCEVIPESEFELLPSFESEYVDSVAAKFQLKIRGDAAKPFTLVKSFKWLSSKAEYDKAFDFVNSLPEEIEDSATTNIEEAVEEAKAVEDKKKTFGFKLHHLFDKNEK